MDTPPLPQPSSSICLALVIAKPLQQAFQQDQDKLSGTQGYMHHNEANLGPELLSCILHPRKYDWP
ncbi:hypothetical protein K443DRAFT_681202 [Laccaria amethystina LaAM-08-1]|uniref:Unplaced genomic scaffold K443scaffold_146, whole genome shotgun sequence n=1 Tax=Laccaria amethystina LaAM-08-1 TaxID=1095629 RepID=A0A0C9XPK4_9AGAR|nr:hypothetical protein K443DRAFT_681202 [Laccaria amethystina LaAM-08-1]